MHSRTRHQPDAGPDNGRAVYGTCPCLSGLPATPSRTFSMFPDKCPVLSGCPAQQICMAPGGFSRSDFGLRAEIARRRIQIQELRRENATLHEQVLRLLAELDDLGIYP